MGLDLNIREIMVVCLAIIITAVANIRTFGLLLVRCFIMSVLERERDTSF
jgi:hypothetical protein